MTSRVGTGLAAGLRAFQTRTGRIVEDPQNNAVLIIDTPQQVREVRQFLAAVDRPLEAEWIELEQAGSDYVAERLKALVPALVADRGLRRELEALEDEAAVAHPGQAVVAGHPHGAAGGVEHQGGERRLDAEGLERQDGLAVVGQPHELGAGGGP